MQISIIQGIFDPTLMQTATLAAQAQSDERLLMAFRDGDEDAFRSLYLRHRDRVWRFVQRLVRDPAQAEEVAQEIWLAVIAGRNAFAGRAKVTTWLFAIAHRCVARRLRGLLRNPESVVEDFEEVADVHQLAHLPMQSLSRIRTPHACMRRSRACPLRNVKRSCCAPKADWTSRRSRSSSAVRRRR